MLGKIVVENIKKNNEKKRNFLTNYEIRYSYWSIFLILSLCTVNNFPFLSFMIAFEPSLFSIVNGPLYLGACLLYGCMSSKTLSPTMIFNGMSVYHIASCYGVSFFPIILLLFRVPIEA